MRISTPILTLVLAGCASQPLGLDSLPEPGLSDCRALDLKGMEGIEGLDVAIAMDASRSTAAPSGADIDVDGRIADFRRSVMTDPGDSLLAAEVVGVRSLLRNTANLDIRYSIVTFSGLKRYPDQHPLQGVVLECEAKTHADVTGDIEALEAALGGVLERGSDGNTNFAAGMRRAIESLEEASPPADARRKLVLFMSDSPTPLLAAPNREIAREDSRMEHAARKAIREGIVFHTFALGKAAAVAPPHPLSRIAGATGGTYRAVEDPRRLHCHLLDSLAL